ncbi:ABC transporter substrate-binding protein, partial [Ideonella dechloratans]|uniref:ABC transporter substrate-binding protein n=1 Tax=Ideonella dechloratans TaxID=36863 RepID=UPI0035B37074
LATAGLPPVVALARVPRNATNEAEWTARGVQEAAHTLMSGNPMAVVCLSAYASTAAVLRALRRAGYAGGCYATSLSSAAAIGPLLGTLAGGLSVTQVMPSPFDTSRPLVAAYQRRLQASGGPAPEYVSLEGWVAGLAVVEGLRRMPRGGSRQAFMQAMEGLAGWDAGGLVLRWDAQRRQAISEVAMTVLDREGRPIR